MEQEAFIALQISMGCSEAGITVRVAKTCFFKKKLQNLVGFNGFLFKAVFVKKAQLDGFQNFYGFSVVTVNTV